MADATVSFILSQLSLLLEREKELLGGLRKEAEYIQGELEHMIAFLRVADTKEESDPQLKIWVSQVREITYETEDILQEYVLKFAHPRHGWFKEICASAKSLRARHRIASKIQEIKFKLENVSKNHQRYKDTYDVINNGSSFTPISNEWYDCRGDALLLEEEDVVGIEKPKEKLLKWLLPNDCGQKVISVVGMGGLGKTTLVKKVYDDALVKATFDHHAWVTVSESFNAEHLLRNIIKQLVHEVKQEPPHELEAKNADELKKFIYNSLQYKAYIIVLDDIWKIDAWESIKYAFPRSCALGCIIITTRFNHIGNVVCTETNGHVYDLDPLNAEESKELFYKKAFPGKSCPPYLREICACILKRCEGLPLAIVVMGGLLATKKNIPEEWKMFERNIGLELEGDSLKKMVKLLSLSYFDLPYHLKAYILYMSIFPEYELIEKWRMIRLWIAEGFVEVKQGKTEEEIAEAYLNELVSRNLIQVADIHEDGRPRSFRIHDIFREYIISKAREHNIFSPTMADKTKWPDKIRRMAICATLNSIPKYFNVKYLRSLFCFDVKDAQAVQNFYKIMHGGCKLLKVLDMRGAPLERIPNAVFKLYNLKYLSLRKTHVKLIPKSIGNLQNLETLDLKHSKVTELPIEILKLRKLRHLLAYSYINQDDTALFDISQSFKATYEIGSYLTALQKLCYIDADEANSIKMVQEIGKLTKLRRLCIRKLKREDGIDLCSSLAKLYDLRSLRIFSIKDGEVMDLDHSLPPSALPILRKVVLHGHLEKLPRWIHSLHGITELELGWSRLKEDPLQHIGVLPNLVCFKMYGFAYEGMGLIFQNEGFQSLKKLVLANLRWLSWVRVEKGSMPHLENLFVRHCKLLEELPEGIESLRSLKFVEFANLSEKFIFKLAKRQLKEGAEWKLAHVPEVNVLYILDGERKALLL